MFFPLAAGLFPTGFDTKYLHVSVNVLVVEHITYGEVRTAGGGGGGEGGESSDTGQYADKNYSASRYIASYMDFMIFSQKYIFDKTLKFSISSQLKLNDLRR